MEQGRLVRVAAKIPIIDRVVGEPLKIAEYVEFATLQPVAVCLRAGDRRSR